MNTYSNNKTAILFFVLPAMILFILLMAIPIIASGYISMLNWDGIGKPIFVGLKNFSDLFINNMDDVWNSVKNTIIFALMCLFIQLPLALILALVLSGGVRGESFFRTVYYMPVVVSSVIIGALFYRIYNADYGLLNSLLDILGLSQFKRGWLADEKTALLAAFFPMVWQYIGYHMLLMYAAIKQVPQDILEAARIDGASKIKTSLRITIPLITPMLEVCAIFAITGSLKIFDLMYILTNNGEPGGLTIVQTGLMYKEFFVFNSAGVGTAVALFIVIECLFFTIAIQKFFKSKDFSY